MLVFCIYSLPYFSRWCILWFLLFVYFVKRDVAVYMCVLHIARSNCKAENNMKGFKASLKFRENLIKFFALIFFLLETNRF